MRIINNSVLLIRFVITIKICLLMRLLLTFLLLLIRFVLFLKELFRALSTLCGHKKIEDEHTA